MREYTDEELAQLLDKDIFHHISEAADSLGVDCYVVGGYVRDIFLERPSNDIDVVVVGSGIAVAEKLRKILGRRAHVSVFRNFGTAQVKFHGMEVEFVGARKESYSHDSRKPIVEDGTLEDDQDRRDFTINAMAICLNKARFGQLVDPFDGIGDLWEGIIRTPLDPDVTFSDDPLRMLRCVRFATQLNFFIEEETFEALSRNAERIRIISGERIAEELCKIMASQYPSKGFFELQRCGLLGLIIPELTALDLVETRNGRAHKNNFHHTLEVLENVARAEERRYEQEKQENPEQPSFKTNIWLRWAALFHDIGKPKTRRFEAGGKVSFHHHDVVGAKLTRKRLRALHFDHHLVEDVSELVNLHLRFHGYVDEPWTDSAVRRYVKDAGHLYERLNRLTRADATTQNRRKAMVFASAMDEMEDRVRELKKKEDFDAIRPDINGNEIMDLLGLEPGPMIGKAYRHMLDYRLDNGPVDHDVAVAELKRWYSEQDQ